MGKSDIIEYVAKTADLTKVDAAKAVDAVIKGIEKGLKETGKVSLVGFGTFNCKERPGRQGTNPLTGKPMQIEAKNVATFKAGSKLKEALN